MKLTYVALLTLLVVGPVYSAHADSSDNLTGELLRVARQYQEENAEGRAQLKPTLQEISELSDAYLTEVASSGEKPSAPLIDASHQVKQLLHS